MAGLLEGVLPYIYSRGDWAKRQLGGLLSDPLGTAQQTAGGLLDAHREQQGLLAQAFANQARPFQVTDKNALGQVAERMLAGPLGFAPAGMATYFRNTQGPKPFNDVPWAMFADDANAVAHYGKNRWQFDSAALPSSEVMDAASPQAQREIARALLKDKGMLRELGANPKQLAREANPGNIVDSAGLWDNPDLAQAVWDNLLEPRGYRAVLTSNGAIVFDDSLIRRAARD
jgi:hypothetical protein